MKLSLHLFLIGVAFMAFGGTAQADTVTFTTTLSGVNEVPPNLSPGFGNSTFIFDTFAHTLTVNVTFSGLLNPTAAAHIHCCGGPGGNAAVAVLFRDFQTSLHLAATAIPLISLIPFLLMPVSLHPLGVRRLKLKPFYLPVCWRGMVTSIFTLYPCFREARSAGNSQQFPNPPP